VRAELAALLRRARERSGLSQAGLQTRLAEALGVEAVSANTISRYERAVLAPTLGTLDALCELLGGEEGALLRAFGQALGEGDAGAAVPQPRGRTKAGADRKTRSRKSGG